MDEKELYNEAIEALNKLEQLSAWEKIEEIEHFASVILTAKNGNEDA